MHWYICSNVVLSLCRVAHLMGENSQLGSVKPNNYSTKLTLTSKVIWKSSTGQSWVGGLKMKFTCLRLLTLNLTFESLNQPWLAIKSSLTNCGIHTAFFYVLCFQTLVINRSQDFIKTWENCKQILEFSFFVLAKFKIKQICLLSDYRQCVHSYKLSLWFYDATSCTWKYLAFCIIYCVI